MNCTITSFYIFLLFMIGPSLKSSAQCADGVNIFSFTHDGRTYEVIRENKTWVNAVACAVERGGILAEINNAEEQNAVALAVRFNASIDNENTISSDGGNAPYVWLGGNDIASEGNWIWDGDNDNNGTPFWIGEVNGMAVGGAYTNWGNEPDNFGSGQDALGLGLTDWINGSAGEWNDISRDNALYFVVEYTTTSTSSIGKLNQSFVITPNPSNDYISINLHDEARQPKELSFFSMDGKLVKRLNLAEEGSLQDVSIIELPRGMYLLQLLASNNRSFYTKLIKYE